MIRLVDEIDILDFSRCDREGRYLIWMEVYELIGRGGELGEGSWEDVMDYLREIVGDEGELGVEELLEEVYNGEDVVKIFLK